MIKRYIIMTLLTLVYLSGLSAQEQKSGIHFFEGTYEQALSAAQKQNKLLFIDFYAVWCGPCKRMSNEVFTVDSVGVYFNEHFISVKLDAEKSENKTAVELFKVEAFPTLAFVNKEGKPLSIHSGALNAVELLEAARIAKGDAISFEELYKRHRNDPADLKIQQELLAKAPNFLAAQEGMDAEKWVVRVRKLYHSYISAKKGPALINKTDYRIINSLGGEDEAHRLEMMEFINQNLDEWIKAVGQAAAYYIVESNDEQIEKLIREGDAEYSKYLDKINGEYKAAYSMVVPPGVVPYERSKMYFDALFELYKNKDAGSYIESLNKYFGLIGESATPADYGKAAQDLYYAMGDKLKVEQHKQAIVWIERALQGEEVLINRINLLVMMGDSYRAMKDFTRARALYNQANIESLQMEKLQTAQSMVQAVVHKKLAELELLEK